MERPWSGPRQDDHGGSRTLGGCLPNPKWLNWSDLRLAGWSSSGPSSYNDRQQERPRQAERSGEPATAHWPVRRDDERGSSKFFHPAAPVVLLAVTIGPPQLLAQIVAVEHHRIDAGCAESPEPVLCGPQQCEADAPAPLGGTDREPVQVAAPAVPARDDRADQLAVVLSQDHRIGVTAEQGRHRLGGIRRPGGVLGRLLPHLQKAADIGGRGCAQREWHRAIVPGACGVPQV